MKILLVLLVSTCIFIGLYNECSGIHPLYHTRQPAQAGADGTSWSRHVVQSAAVQSRCPAGVAVVNCMVDPCKRGCRDYPSATCVAKYCGGCSADWFYNGQLVSCH